MWRKLLIIIILSLFVGYYSFRNNNDDLVVTFFDVGQGDGIFLKTPSGQNVLIDGGPDNTVLYELGKVLPYWEHTLDMVMLTHPDADHITGLIEVLNRYTVTVVLMPEYVHTTPEYEAWMRILRERNITVILTYAGMRFSLDDNISCDILWPMKGWSGSESANDYSLVSRCVYHNVAFLFTGDIESVVENELLLRFATVDADVLKVAHHGSNTSTTQGFLNAVDPSFAVIQSGRENRFGHPHTRILRRIERKKITVLRTDVFGSISLHSNGDVLWIPGVPGF